MMKNSHGNKPASVLNATSGVAGISLAQARSLRSPATMRWITATYPFFEEGFALSCLIWIICRL